jgi:hypothetical protein
LALGIRQQPPQLFFHRTADEVRRSQVSLTLGGFRLQQMPLPRAHFLELSALRDTDPFMDRFIRFQFTHVISFV